MANAISCPHCGKTFEITEAFKGQIENEVKKETEERLTKEFEEKNRLEVLDLKKALSEKDKKVGEMREQELKLREEGRVLEEKQKEMDLEINRRVDDERKKVTELVVKEEVERHRMRDLEKDKVIDDLKKSLEDAQRKAQQGSQQLQGEVMELDLEDILKSAFPTDIIESVGKGVKGADIRQIVKTNKGNSCGVILWESKRTKAWTDDWLGKLKDDLRAEGANIPIIVSTVLPEEAKNGFGVREGVWVVSYNLVLPLATLLRKNLTELAYKDYLSQNKGEKAELLYQYIIGHEFRQQFEAMAEIYRDMRDQIMKERVAFEKSWKVREEQVNKLYLSAANVYGSIQGKVGSQMPQIKGMDLLDGGEED